MTKFGRETVTKAELGDALASQMKWSYPFAKGFIDNVFRVVADSLVAETSVKLPGFGTFQVRQKKGRPGRDPRRNKITPVSPRLSVTLRVGDKMKVRLEGLALPADVSC